MPHFPQTVGISLAKVKDSDGNVVSEHSGNPIAASLITKDLDFDSRSAMKYIDAVVAEVTDAEKLDLINVMLGYRDNLSEDVNWQTPQSLEELADVLFTRNTARYHKLQINSNSVGVFWRLGSLEFFGTTHGRRF